MGEIDALGAKRELIKMVPRPVPALVETWQDEAGIDQTIWGVATTGVGAVTRDALEPPYLKVIISGGAALATALLYGLQRWYCAPDTTQANYLKESILRTLNMEFEASFIFPDLFDNTQFFMGLGFAQNVTEASPNIIGFIMDAADNLRAITGDLVGWTSLPFLTVAAITWPNWIKYRIEVLPGRVNFYANGVLLATGTANLPHFAMYPVWNVIQENAGGLPLLQVGVIRIWPEDILR